MSLELPQLNRKSASVLLVDDDERNLMALTAALDSLGLNIATAQTGEEALRLLLRADFAVVLMDVRMPGMGGLDAATLIRGRSRVTPVIFVTGLADSPEHIRRGYEAGAVDYIVKPYDPVVLRSKVSVLVDLWVAKEQLRRSEQDALERERFIGILAHDLRNPLAAISMAAEFLGETAEPQYGNIGKRIKRSSDRMRRMIDDVLDFARGRLAGGIPIQERVGDLAAVCKTVVDELQLAYPARTIHLATSSSLTGSFDSDRIAQALSNVVGNALQHGTGAIHVEAQVADGKVQVRVSNEGAAIPEAKLAELFEPFRGDSRSGLGLGLFIAKEIARAHRGSIFATSTSERTTFTLELPVVPT